MIWLLITFGAALLLLLFLIRASGVKPGVHPGRLDSGLVKRRWAEVETSSRRAGTGRKQALIEADKLLGYVLKQLGYSGTTLAERLRSAERHLSDKEAVWAAHKLRNRLVHEPEADLVGGMGKRELAALKQAIRDLGVKL